MKQARKKNSCFYTHAVFLIVFLSTLVLSGCSTAVDQIYHYNQKVQNKIFKQSLRADRSRKKGAMTQKDLGSLTNQLLPTTKSLFDQKKELRISVDVTKQKAEQFFSYLSSNLPINIIVAPKTKATISLKLNNATIPQLLSAVSQLYHLTFTKEPYGYIVSNEKLALRTYHVIRLNMERKGVSNMGVQGVGLGGGGVKEGKAAKIGKSNASNVQSTFTDKKFWKNLEKDLKLIIKPDKGSKVLINENSGLVIVRAFPKTQLLVNNFLHKMNIVDTKEVVIEAKFLEIELSKKFTSGINWSLAHMDYVGTKGVINYATTNRFKFTTAITLLSSQGKVNTLSSPRVTTLNNKQALIKIGTDRYFVTKVSSSEEEGVAGAPPKTTQDVTLTPFFSGIALGVLPEIDDNNNIVLHIHPMISTITEENREITLSSSEVLELPMAVARSREADEIVKAKNGQIIVLGGLMETTASEAHTALPGLNFFGVRPMKSDESTTRELVILMKPTIVNRTTWVNDMMKTQSNFGTANGLTKVQDRLFPPTNNNS